MSLVPAPVVEAPQPLSPNGQVMVEDKPLTQKWWFWTAVGVATAALTGSIVYAATRPSGTSLEAIHVR